MPRTRVDEVEVRVDADLNPATRELRRASRETDKAARAMSRDFDRVDKSARNLNNGVNLMGVAVAAFGVVAARSTLRMFEFASSVEEQGSKAAVVFGANIGRVREELADLGREVGRSRYELLNMASTLQDTFVPLGFTREAAAELSLQMTRLAVDVGSFNNVASDQVAVAFQSAIVGNHETVRRFGIVITEATLKAEAYASGIAEVGDELTQQDKIQARINLILAGTSDAQGDAARTAGTYANQMARLRGNFQEYIVALTNGNLERASFLVRKLGDAFEFLEDRTSRVNLIRQINDPQSGFVSGSNTDAQIELLRTYDERNTINRTFDRARRDFVRAGRGTAQDYIDYRIEGLRQTQRNAAQAGGPNDLSFQPNLYYNERDRDTANDLGVFGGAGERINLNSSNLALQEYERRQVAERSARTAGSLDPFGGSGEHLDEAIENAQRGLDRIKEVNDAVSDSFGELGDNIADGLATAFVNGKLELDSFEDLFKGFIANIIAEHLKLAFVDRGIGLLGSFISGFGGGRSVGGRTDAPVANQQGGYLQPGRLGLVGENGPELIVPKVGSTIIPNGQGVGVGGNSIVMNLDFNTGISQADRANILGMLPDIQERIGVSVLNALNRGGVASNTIRTR